jgi:hypothetical protein
MNLSNLAKDFREMKVRNKTRNRYWEPFMKKYKCDIICELGVSKGANFFEMIRHDPKLAVAVDSWIDDGTISRNDSRYSQDELNRRYEYFVKSVSDKPFVKVYREYTFDAVKHFKDNYFDLVYIDADHSYEGCLRDIEDWYPKVRKGKFLLGDDYRPYEGRDPDIKFGVVEAVNEFAKKNGLRVFQIRKYGWGLVKK